MMTMLHRWIQRDPRQRLTCSDTDHPVLFAGTWQQSWEPGLVNHSVLPYQVADPWELHSSSRWHYLAWMRAYFEEVHTGRHQKRKCRSVHQPFDRVLAQVTCNRQYPWPYRFASLTHPPSSCLRESCHPHTPSRHSAHRHAQQSRRAIWYSDVINQR